MIQFDSNRRQLLDALLAGHGAAPRDTSLPRVDRTSPVPVSFAQERMWFLHQLEPGCHYNDRLDIRVHGPLDVKALERSLAGIVTRHETLRTTYVVADGRPLQRIDAPVHVALQTIDLSGAPEADREGRAIDLARTMARQPFDLAEGPVWRACLYQLSPHDHLLALTIHHIAVDGWSKQVLVDELADGYRAACAGEAMTGLVPATQYAEYAAWQRERMSSGAFDQDLAFWRNELEGIPALLTLPTDRPRPSAQSFRGARHPFSVSRQTTERLLALGHREQATLFMTLLSAFAALLHRYTGEPDIVIGTPVANRHLVDVERLIGCFVNTIALRADVSPALTFRELLGRMRQGALNAYTHQQLPFERLVEEIRPERDQSFNPVFQVMLILQGSRLSAVGAGDVTLAPFDDHTETAKFDLTLNLTESEGGLTGSIEYATDLFDASTIARMSGHLSRLIEAAVEDPDCPIGKLPLLDRSERQTVLETWNATDVDRMPTGVHRLFERRSTLAPEAIAVEFESTSLTYADLDRRANLIAGRLRESGVGPEARVGISFEPGVDLCVALLGVLKRGAAYVPLDPAHPSARLECMVRDSGLSLVLTTGDLRTRWQRLGLQALCVDLVTDADDAVGGTGVHVDPDWLAYVIYTSGSTGQPKGVAMPHRSLANLIAWQLERSTCGLESRTLQFASPSFDVSFQEMFATWAAGGTLVIAPGDIRRDARALLRFVARRRIERVFLPFVALQGLSDAAERDPSLRLSLREIVTAGEALRLTPAITSLMARLPDGLLENQYGPTEAHVVSSFAMRAPIEGAPVLPPIGRPIANARLYVLDSEQNPAPIGVPGELFIGGAPVASGYLGKPALTSERFVPDPFRGESRGVMYRTGDKARWRADGNLEFLGRLDDQVKIRGYRVEVGEVEAVLSRHPAVRDVAVVCRDSDGTERRLVAYVVADRSASPQAFRAFLGERLPDYMIPAEFVPLDELPLTATGKLDRRRLPAPSNARGVETVYVPPSSETEKILSEIWIEVLNIDRVGVHDSFFELGGHSLLATRLMFRIRDAFAVDVPLRRLFEDPTIAGVSAAIGEARGDDSVALPLPSVTADAPNLYEPFPLTDVQQAYWVGRNDSLELGGTSCHMYTELEVAGLDVVRLEAAVRALIDRHPILRAVVRADGQQQILREVPPYPVEVLDFRGGDPQTVEAELRTIRERMSWQVMPADRWPLFEVRVSRLDARDRIHVDFDLLIGDALSIQILVRELLHLYERPGDPLPPLDISFRDYVLAENALQSSEVYRRSKEYWLKRLDSIPPAPDLPLVKNPENVRGAAFSRRSARLDGATWNRLKRRAARSGLTPSGTLLAAFADVLTTWSSSRRYAINVTLFNRLPVHPHVNGLVGDFTSVTLLEVDHSAAESFEARARRLQEQLWSDIDHRHFSGVQVLRELARSQGRAPKAAMPVVFTSTLNIDQVNAETAGLIRRKDVVVYGISQTPQVWLDHQIYEDAGDLVFNWDSVDELLPPDLLDDMFDAYRSLVQRLAAEEEAWCRIGRNLVPADQLAMRSEINATQGVLPAGLLHSGFFEQAARRPEATAIVTPELSLTYQELRGRALAVSQALRRLGVQRSGLVAIVMEKGWEQVAAALGILHAGAAYLPIDAGLPAARIGQLLALGEVNVVLTQSRSDDALELPVGIERVVVDRLPLASDVEPIASNADDLAYVIFTSGSTGVPKGVMIDHRGALNTVLDVNERFGVTEADRVLALSSLSFDLSVYDVFGTLAAGGTIVLPDAAAFRDPAHWTTLAERHGVTIWNSVPALLEMWLDHLSSLDRRPDLALRLAMLSGDWIPVALPDRLRTAKPDVEIVSLGGATEASIWSIVHPIGRIGADWPSVPYGRPMRNQTFHVLDDAMEPRPDWVAGHLFIGGIGLAQGYWRDPEKTRDRFIIHPVTGERLYSTGDLGRYRPCGNIEFLGREDLQVKVQGHRIELAEIEAALSECPGVRMNVVRTLGDRFGSKRLAAYIVADSERIIGADEVQRFLGERLPEYMVPSTIVFIDSLPLNANGKIDRQALPAPEEASTEGARPFVAPRTAVEQAVAGIWKELLGVSSVSADDDFFELGGDSLLGTRAVLLMRRTFAIELPVRSIFQHSTTAALSAFIEQIVLAEID